MSSENTSSPPITHSSPSSPPSSGSQHWVLTAIGKIGAYAMVGPVAWQLPSLLREDVWTGVLALTLVLAVAAPTALKDAATVIQGRIGK